MTKLEGFARCWIGGAHPTRAQWPVRLGAIAPSRSRTFREVCFGEGAETNTRRLRQGYGEPRRAPIPTVAQPLSPGLRRAKGQAVRSPDR